jgi:hypothetical protein
LLATGLMTRRLEFVHFRKDSSSKHRLFFHSPEFRSSLNKHVCLIYIDRPTQMFYCGGSHSEETAYER